MQKLRLIAKDDEGEIVLNLSVKDGMSDDEVLEAINKATRDYLATKEGQNIYATNAGYFDYSAFETYVPNEICSKYGIEKDKIPDKLVLVDNVMLVDEEDIEMER